MRAFNGEAEMAVGVLNVVRVVVCVTDGTELGWSCH